MYRKIVALLLALLALCFPLCVFAEGAEENTTEDVSADTEAPEEEPSTGNVMVIKNLNTGNNLPLKSAKSRVYQTGVAARLMTALTAFECIEDVKAKISVPLCASDKKLRGDCSYIGFSYSETDDALTLEDFLSAALVSSAADACIALAVASSRHMAGEAMDYSHNYSAAASASVSERAHINDFVALMNRRAKELGCKDTLFSSCTGISDGKSRTTAEDIALIAAALCSHGKLYEISDKASYVLSTGSNQIFTKNALKSEYNLKGYKLDGVKGITAGYLQGPDSYCVVTSAESGGLSYVFVCVNTKPQTGTGGSGQSGSGGSGGQGEDGKEDEKEYSAEISVYKTIHKFLPWALKSFRYVVVISPYKAIATVPVKAGKNRDSVTIIARDVIELLITKDMVPETDIAVKYTDLSDLTLTAPVAEGQEVGSVSVYLKGELVGESPLVTNDAVMESGALSAVDKIQRALTSSLMKKIYKWALIVFAAYLLIVFAAFVYRVVRRHIEASKGDR